jgi:hypothetical protein
MMALSKEEIRKMQYQDAGLQDAGLIAPALFYHEVAQAPGAGALSAGLDHVNSLEQHIAELKARLQYMVNRFRETERHNQLLTDQMRVVSDRFDAANRDGALLVAEIKALKAKYEPAPEPAPNPWGKMFRGGIGSAIER